MRSPDFWNYFDQVARPRLALRANTFSRAFTYLDHFDRPVGIVETGCVRAKDAWRADGQSTILFDKYAEFHPGSVVLSVDSDPAATALCRSLVTSNTRIHTSDSIAFLKSLTERPPPELGSIDLLYLDSLEVDANFEDPLPSAVHHLKELLAVESLIRPDTLVVVDDSPSQFLGVCAENGSVKPIRGPRIGGKGKLIAEYASIIGAELCFSEYQCGWCGFGRFSGSSSRFVSLPKAFGSTTLPAASTTRTGIAKPTPATPDVQDASAAPVTPTEPPKAASRAFKQPPTALPELASRIAGALSSADRAQLAWQLLADKAEEVTFRRSGIRWTALPWDYVISEHLFVHGGFQAAEVRSVLAWMRRQHRFATPRDLIIEIGANIGTSTILFAQETDCRVLAIEPVPELYALLCRNVADNGFAPRVTCLHAAISSATGRVRMILPWGNGGAAEVCRPGHEPSWSGRYPVRGIVEVPAMTMAEVINAHGVTPERVALVWSDSQGCEAEVIESGRSLWEAGVPLFAELDPQSFPDRTEALVAAAAARFNGFIAAESLIKDATARVQPIAELAAFCRRLGPDASDALFLPRGFEVRPGVGDTTRL